MKYTPDRSLVLSAFDVGATQSITPEGYLYCYQVPIARIGSQQYLNIELEPDCEGGHDGVIHVERRAEDVFHPDTIASFEGKPVTDDHPEEMLGPESAVHHIVGTTLNVRRGNGDLMDFLVADLLIYDKDAIDAVRAGKRQVSCGYGSDYESLGPGRARQHTIIGNHVALVGRGRCGPSCAIGDEDMVSKKQEEKAPLKVQGTPKKGFWDRLKGFMDSEGAAFAEGETGALSFNDETLPSTSGMESSSSVGGDTHIHIHAGPAGATTIAPTTDKKSKDKKASKDDEGTAEEMEEEETMDAEPDDDEDDKKEVMDAVSKAYDAAMKKIRDKKGTKDKKSKDVKPAKDKAVKDGDKEDDEDSDDKETKDAKADTEEGEAEAEGSVETADEDGDDKDGDKKDNKDKKATKDSAPLKNDFKGLVSDVEILAPGLKMPTFDAAADLKATNDSMCLMRRRALAAHVKTPEGDETLTMLNGGKKLELRNLTCDQASVFFTSAVAFARDRNSNPGKLKMGKSTQDAKAPTSIADFNKLTTEHYNNQRPKAATKSA